MFEKFIDKKVWDCTLKYIRMMRINKEKFFESLKDSKSVERYASEISKLWNVDHSFMTDAINELSIMVKDRDVSLALKYGDDLTQRSIKLQNTWQEYNNIDYQVYKLNPERDFTLMEQRYVNRHISYYKNQLKAVDNALDKDSYLSTIVSKYDKIDKSIPYFSHTTGQIVSYQTIATYNSMLFNWNLTHSAWNRTEYDSKLLGNNLWYLPAHPYACPHCMEYQGKVYTTDPKDKRYPQKEDAIRGGVGHPNCKHVWTLYWSKEQIQEDKYNSAEWEEKYRNEQKLQSLDLEKSRLLSDRRIYKSLGDEAKVDEITSKIKAIREKKKQIDQS